MTNGTEHYLIQAEAPHGRDFQYREVDLRDYLAVLRRSKWLIAALTGVGLALGAAYLYFAQPQYQVDALIQLDENTGSPDVLGQITALFEGEVPLNAELEILRSRLVAGRVVDQLQLDLFAEPAYFPIIGAALARRYEGDPPAPAPMLNLNWTNGLLMTLGLRPLSEYAWGGEVLRLDQFDVPPSYLNTDMLLVADGDGGYRLLDEADGRLLLLGRVGEQASIATADGALTARVTELRARPGTRFRLRKEAWVDAVSRLQSQFRAREKGRQTGVLEISLQGDDPRRAAEIVNTIADVYLTQNIERRSADAEQTLNFLREQLPQVREQVERAEQALNDYQLQHGSVNLPREANSVLDSVVDLEAQLIQLRQRRAQLRQRYKPAHPNVAAIDAQIARLNDEMDNFSGRVQSLPSAQQETLRLSRDVKVSTQLYLALRNSIQELEVAKAGTPGNVRVVDQALVPQQPFSPVPALVFGVSGMSGFIFGVLVCFVRQGMRRGETDAELIERRLRLPVYGALPYSALQRKLGRTVRRGRGEFALLSTLDPDDNTIESLRGLRETLQFALAGARNNIIMITGLTPGVGKSFLCANLGGLLASSGRRVLLIDGDLRNGQLHAFFGLERDIGLAELLSGGGSRALPSTATASATVSRLFGDTGLPRQAMRDTGLSGLDLIGNGAPPPNPAELLQQQRFVDVLRELSAHYDCVLIDTPPLLSVADALTVGRIAGSSVMVLGTGMHPAREIEFGAKRLLQAGAALRGLVLNDVNATIKRYGGSYSPAYGNAR